MSNDQKIKKLEKEIERLTIKKDNLRAQIGSKAAQLEVFYYKSWLKHKNLTK